MSYNVEYLSCLSKRLGYYLFDSNARSSSEGKKKNTFIFETMRNKNKILFYLGIKIKCSLRWTEPEINDEDEKAQGERAHGAGQTDSSAEILTFVLVMMS